MTSVKKILSVGSRPVEPLSVILTQKILPDIDNILDTEGSVDGKVHQLSELITKAPGLSLERSITLCFIFWKLDKSSATPSEASIGYNIASRLYKTIKALIPEKNRTDFERLIERLQAAAQINYPMKTGFDLADSLPVKAHSSENQLEFSLRVFAQILLETIFSSPLFAGRKIPSDPGFVYRPINDQIELTFIHPDLAGIRILTGNKFLTVNFPKNPNCVVRLDLRSNPDVCDLYYFLSPDIRIPDTAEKELAEQNRKNTKNVSLHLTKEQGSVLLKVTAPTSLMPTISTEVFANKEIRSVWVDKNRFDFIKQIDSEGWQEIAANLSEFERIGSQDAIDKLLAAVLSKFSATKADIIKASVKVKPQNGNCCFCLNLKIPKENPNCAVLLDDRILKIQLLTDHAMNMKRLAVFNSNGKPILDMLGTKPGLRK